jgi:hypothetical protein
LPKNIENNDQDDDDKPFLVPDFLVVDMDARVVMLKA